MCASKSQWEPTLPSSQGCEETLSTQEAPQGGDRTFVPKALCSVSGQHTGNPELHPTQQYRASAPPLSWGGLRRDSGVLEISASPGGNKAPHHGVKRGHGRGRSSDPTQQKQGPLQPWVSEEPHRALETGLSHLAIMRWCLSFPCRSDSQEASQSRRLK